ncbi:DUF1254 domain-containing protein [Xanthobacter sp. TB0136]|uniref:DUF1254 domain-containing protein n=1 Tax=Xanthobacter sp. TB0136 TaxID=3459177 RepID=UPI004038FC53
MLKPSLFALLLGSGLVALAPAISPLSAPAMAQMQPQRTFADLNVPSAEVTPQASYVRAIARMAYIWGWPLVNMQNRFDSITQAPVPALLGGMVPVAPAGQIAMLHDYVDPDERFIACPNQDVVYGLGYFDLDKEPMVVQVPDFGKRFWVYAAYDQRTDQFGKFGSPYGTKPGFYLLVGPNWKGEVPKGITGVAQSSTALGNLVPRVFMDDTAADRVAIQPLINQIVVYPLSQFDGSMKTVVWSKLPHIDNPDTDSAGETRWVVPEKFFSQLGKAMDRVPPLPGEEALYAQFRWLIDLAEKNPDIRKVIDAEAVASEQDVIADFFRWDRNGRPAGNNWYRSLHNAQWGVDYYDRTGTARSNMLENRPNETEYFYTDFDGDGVQLNSAKSYEVTFPAGQIPPVKGFWSLTIYNQYHLFTPNRLNRYSLGTKNADLVKNSDGSLTIHVSREPPKGKPEANWLPAPEGDFSLYIRAYWGEEPILDGSWQPPAIRAGG